MSPLTAALLGTVQGLTEFLPISSSAHLIIARRLFGVELAPPLDLAFDVACHVGTLLAVVAFFWPELLGMARGLPRALRPQADMAGRRVQLIAIGTLPIVVVGALGFTAVVEMLRTPAVAAAALALGSLLLFAAERLSTRTRLEGDLRPRDALVVGVAQVLALIPGVSRSGVTISVGMMLGYHRPDIARFTFLLSVPAILAAAAKNALDLRGAALTQAELYAFVIGMVTSGIVGYLAIAFFIRFVANHRLDVFAWYRLALAAVLVIDLATG
jgi:undecaprenyl-diphosphatase